MAIRDRITQFVTYLVKQIKCSQGGILIGRVTGEGKAQEITVGSGLSLSGTTLTVTGGTFAAASHTHALSDLSQSAAESGQVVTWNGSAWSASTIPSSTGGNSASDSGKLVKFDSNGAITVSWLKLPQCQSQDAKTISPLIYPPDYGSTNAGSSFESIYKLPLLDNMFPDTVLAKTSRTDGTVSYNDLVDVPASVSLTASKSVANSAARLALSLEAAQGFAVVDADTGKTWMLVDGGTPSVSGDWLQLGDRDITAADITDPENLVTNARVASAIESDPSAIRAAAKASPGSEYRHGNDAAIRALKETLDSGADAAIGVITDSTGNATDEWVYLTTTAIAAQYPAHRVEYRLWNSSTNVFDLTTVQSGIGGDRRIEYPTGSTFAFYRPVTDMLDNVTGSDIEIQAQISIATGSHPTTDTVLYFMGDPVAGRLWLQVSNAGWLGLYWAEDASGTTNKSAGATTTAPAMTVGVKRTYKVTVDINNGSGGHDVKFWYADGTGAFTQIGATVTGAGTTTVYSPLSTQFISINSRGIAPVGGVTFYRANIYKGIGGQPLLSERIDKWRLNTSGSGNMANLTGAPVLYVDNIAVSGWALSNHIANAAPALAYLDRNKLFWLVASSHNEQGASADTWAAKVDSLAAVVNAYSVYDSPLVIATQNLSNPAGTQAQYATAHNLRVIEMLSTAARKNWPLIDIAGAWRDYGTWTTLVDATGIHPNTSGSVLTKNTLLGALGY